MKLLMHNGPGFISGAIRWQTRGKYSHGSILFSDGTVFESREFKGVRRLRVEDLMQSMIEDERIAIDSYKFLRPVNETMARTFCESQLGKKYDYWSVFRFLTRQSEGRGSGEDWFCSEYQVAAARAGGVELFKLTEPYEVAPGLIPRSLALEYEGSIL